MKNTLRSTDKLNAAALLGRAARPATLVLLLTLVMLAGQLVGCSPVVQAGSKGNTTYYEGPVKSRYAVNANRR